MTTDSAIVCSVGGASQKMIKIWREAVKYLPSVDTAKCLRCSGSFLICSMVALKEEMEKRKSGQWQQSVVAIDCNNSGVAHSSHL